MFDDLLLILIIFILLLLLINIFLLELILKNQILRFYEFFIERKSFEILFHVLNLNTATKLLQQTSEVILIEMSWIFL